MKNKILEVCEEYFTVQKKMIKLGIKSISGANGVEFATESWRSEYNQIYLDVETFKKLFPNNKGRTYYASNRHNYEEKYKNVTFKATNGKPMASFNPM